MFLIFYILFLLAPSPVSADTGHIVISEIETYGQTATDEFIRLYNPTGATVDISGWKLAKKTSSGSESNLVSAFPNGTIIPPNSGFLIAHQTGYQGSETPNTRYSGASYSIADNNTIILKDASGAVIDKVGFGAATDFESAPAANPEPGKSIKRLNNNDTDNNKNDFSAETADIDNTETPPNPPFPKEGIISSAQYGDILINEVVPNPSEGKEWIELYNTTSNAISLAGWKISDGSSVIYEPAGEIPANGFFTAEVNNRLNNSGDAIYLSDANGKSISQLIYGDWLNAKIPAPAKGESIARNPQGDYEISTTPTKNTANQFTQPLTTVNDSVNGVSTTSTPKQNIDDIKNYITIAEILPNPADSDTDNEYITLFNNNENDLNLGGFYLDDAEGGSPPYRIPAGTIIKAKNSLTFYRSKTKLALNNTEDSVRLLAPDKKEILNIAYEDAKEGAIYSCQNEKCKWSGSVIPASSVIPAKAGIQSQKLKSNAATGIVIAPPGLFGKQIAYINGLQIYMYSSDWPELAEGDKISVFGEPSTYYNEPRLKLKNKNSITIISRGNKIAPEAITSEDIGDDNVGRLITLEGEIIEKTAKKITLDSGGIEIAIYNKNNIPLPDIKEKDTIKISGVLSKYKDDFRILPLSGDDFEIINSANATAKDIDKPSSLWQYVASTLTIGAFAGTIYWRRKKNGNTTNTAAGPLG